MNGQRYVILGAARPRSAWFATVSQWATSSAIPAEFVKCIGTDEVVTRLASGRAFSAVLLDGGLPGVDRNVLQAALEAGAAPIVVHDGAIRRDWQALGARAVLDPQFGRAELLDVLASTSALISRAEPVPIDPTPPRSDDPRSGALICVVGAGGTGTSTIAMAAAQALGQRAADDGRRIVLADLCGRAEQAMLHDTRAIAPGLQELVQAHRTRAVGDVDASQFCVPVHNRNYDLLMGLRRRRLWSSLRPAPTIAALQSLRVTYNTIVADCDADLEGEDEGGSSDVEERNLLSRTATTDATVVLVVGQATLKGLHSLTRVMHDLRSFGVPESRIQPVVNYAPGSPRARAGYATALAELCTTDAGRPERSGGPAPPAPGVPAPPVFVPVRNIDECIRAGALLPPSVTDPVLAAVTYHLTTRAAQPAVSASRWRRFRTVEPTAQASAS